MVRLRNHPARLAPCIGTFLSTKHRAARNNRAVSPLTDARIAAAQALCRRLGVARLDVFGSAATGAFDPQRSDIDFIVEFGNLPGTSLFERYFEMKESLQALFERPVDLVMGRRAGRPHEGFSVRRGSGRGPPGGELAR